MLTQPVLAEDDPRRANYTETTYQGSRGGWLPTPDKPVPGTPKEEN